LSKHVLMTADIGTQGTKVALVDTDGQIVASAFRPSNLICHPGGQWEQNPAEMLSSVIDGMQDVLLEADIPANYVLAIGLDGQMAGIMGIDSDWNAVTPYDSWLDTRCEAYMPHIKSWGEEDYIRITGCPVTYAHGPKKIWWKHERPGVYERIAKFVVPSVYIAGKLAGLKADQAFIDYTHLHFSGFADVEQQTWSETLLNVFDISRDKMPNIVNPWDVIGSLSSEFASKTGLLQGTPIVAGCGDTAAATLGAGIVKAGQLFDVAGTASILACCTDSYHPDTKNRTLIYARSVIPGLWTPLAYINGGGQCLAWFRDQWKGEAGALSYDDLNALGEKAVPGSDGLFFVPHFGGRVCPNNPDLRGSWVGLSWSHRRGEMYRAILESIAYEYRYYLDILERLTGSIAYSHVHAVGGGTKSALFNTIKSDVLGVPYQTMRNPDTPLIANAAIAGYGVGLFPDIVGAITQFTSANDSYMPDSGRHEAYRQYAHSYQTVLDDMTELYKKIKR